MSPGSWRSTLRAVIDAASLLAALVFIGSYFPRAVMFTPTITNGGDMGSHYYPALFLREVLLPKGQLSGWCPGNYCGFPLFQFYFPLPFLNIVALSAAMPLTIAFKIGTVLGTFLLPVCSYFGLRLLGTPFPGPALGALASLCFLFMEANSMWGGNIPSTLAGEFALSFGLALTVLFFGALRRAVETGRGVAWTGLLEAAIGLSHGYTLLWAGFGSLLELVATRGWWRRLGILVCVHGLAILLMALWLVPLVVYAPWTTAYNHAWPIRDWQEVLPPILWPATGIAIVSAVLVGILALLRREAYPRGLATLWGTMLVAGLFWLTGHSFHVVDIRFVPFVQLGLCLAAGAGLGHLLSRLPAIEVLPVAAALAVMPFVQQRVTFIPAWIKWNYSGFEAKAPWGTVTQLAEHLRGDFRDPRVVYEHSPDHEALGTVRIFESLPLFTGRSTLEGLYMQGSPTAPFVFYVQSEISKAHSCPFPDWGCARFDLARGLEHLRMMNVSQFIVRSDQVKQAAARLPGLALEKRAGAYEIWRLIENDGRYAVPLSRAPYAIRTPSWKETAYEWFKRARPDDAVPVFVGEGDDVSSTAFAAVLDAVPEDPPLVPLAAPPAIAEHLEVDRVTLTGCRPGHPVLVRISYHPRWRARTGETVWLAGPSFMLVFPRGERVELEFGDPPIVVASEAASLLGLALFLLAVTPLGRPLAAPLRRFGRRARMLPPLRPVSDLVAQSASWSPARRRLTLALVLVLASAVLGGAAWALWRPAADLRYRQAQKLHGDGRLDEALAYFREAAALAPLSTTAVHATYFEGQILLRQERWAEAEEAFGRLVQRFPDGLNAPEARYHLGLARWHLGKRDAAVAAWRVVVQRYGDSAWAQHAAARLREAGVDPAAP